MRRSGSRSPRRARKASAPKALPENDLMSRGAWKLFVLWTVFFWGIIGVSGAFFYIRNFDFTTSARIALYSVSIWLNGVLVVFWYNRDAHDAVATWILSYGITNLLWEIPFITLAHRSFVGISTLPELISSMEFARESPLNMWFWMLGSFGVCDLRTIRVDGTFYSLELFSFMNVASTVLFWYWNKKRSPYRYLIPVLTAGVPFAATFIFSFAEVANGLPNMGGDLADTWLTLVWTQYQYCLFPVFVAYLAFPLMVKDIRSHKSAF